MPHPIRKVKASVLVKDLEAQLSDFQVMQKHGLTAEQLEYLFHKMVQVGLITRQMLESRAALAETNVTKAFVEVQQSMDELDQIDDTVSERVYSDHTETLSSGRLPSEQAQNHPTGDDSAYEEALRILAKDSSTPRPAPPASPSGRKIIRASELVKDITSGMTDPQLMEKYQIKPRQLEFMLRKLVEAGKITETQLLERTSISSTAITKAFVDVYQSLRELDENDWGA